MEALHVLEQKIATLVDLVRKTRADNARLEAENVQLVAHVKALELSHTTDVKQEQQLAREKELTKSVVDGLIERISSLTESERQQ